MASTRAKAGSQPSRPHVVDLFCGAGGLTLASHNAGFTTRSAFDIDTDLTSSFGDNFPSTSLHHVDLGHTPPEEIADLVGDGRISGVVGGPPCQGFSDIGRHRHNDPRNALVGRFMSVVAELKPQFFLMENVPGLGNERHATILDDALDLVPSTYTILDKLFLNAADYGAATDRTRTIIFGYDPSSVDALSSQDLITGGQSRSTTVRDAIADLPTPQITEFASLPYTDRGPISSYAKLLRSSPPSGLSSDYARELQRRGCVTGIDATIHSAAVIERFMTVGQGERDPISKYPRLSWDETAPVLRAGTGRDNGSFQAARPIHPEEPRVISVREAARLQGFPDWFQFSTTKWHSHRMIGNSVSPIFAQAVMKSIRTRLEVG